MCIASRLGASLDIKRSAYGGPILEPLATTYVLEMSGADAEETGFESIGRVEEEPRLHIAGDGLQPVELPVSELADAWRSPLAQGGGR